jgi:hypothetical protein
MYMNSVIRLFYYHGEYKTYYNNGNLKTGEFYDYNKKTGVWEEWYSTGKKRSKTVYKNNKKNGIYKLWLRNGQLKSTSFYVNNKLDSYYVNKNRFGKVKHKSFRYNYKKVNKETRKRIYEKFYFIQRGWKKYKQNKIELVRGKYLYKDLNNLISKY